MQRMSSCLYTVMHLAESHSPYFFSSLSLAIHGAEASSISNWREYLSAVCFFGFTLNATICNFPRGASCPLLNLLRTRGSVVTLRVTKLQP
jgi:hypothetical protein